MYSTPESSLFRRHAQCTLCFPPILGKRHDLHEHLCLVDFERESQLGVRRLVALPERCEPGLPNGIRVTLYLVSAHDQRKPFMEVVLNDTKHLLTMFHDSDDRKRVQVSRKCEAVILAD